MKTDKYTELICKGFCSFYKAGKEEMACETYNFLASKFTPETLVPSTQEIKAASDFSCDMEIKKNICARCDFLIDGCDFREGLGSIPCGGYAIVEWLIKSKQQAS